MPVERNVFPKPFWIAVIMPVLVAPSTVMSPGSIPPISPVTMAAVSSAMNVCTLVLETRTIMRIMPIAKPNSILVDSAMSHFLSL